MTSKAIVRALAAPLPLALALCLAPAAAATEKSAPATTAATAAAPSSAVPAAPAPSRAGTVNINTGTAAELARLPRVGAKLADRIVAQRTQHGPFKRVEDLMEVKGVGEKMFVSLKPYLSVSGQTTLAAKVGGPTRGARSGAKAGSNASPARSKATRTPKGGGTATSPASR